MGVQGTTEDREALTGLAAFVQKYSAAASDPDGRRTVLAWPTTDAPPFRPASYRFTLSTVEIKNTRSLHVDSVKGVVSAAVGIDAPVTQTASLGDHNNGVFAAELAIGPILVEKPHIGVAFNYVLTNSGHESQAKIDSTLTKTGEALAAAGAKAATTGVGAALGATIGTAVLPIIGSIIGLAAGWLVDELIGILLADCDGPVASEQPVFKGQDLWDMTHRLGTNEVYYHQTTHAGLDSPSGCGSNSIYIVNWSIFRS